MKYDRATIFWFLVMFTIGSLIGLAVAATTEPETNENPNIYTEEP